MRVLLASFGSFGDLNPYIGLGLALRARGHQPVLAVTRAYQHLVEAAGLECRPIRPEGDPHDGAIVSRIMDPLRGPEFLIRQVLMPNLRDMYDDLAEVSRDVDVVVSHPLTFAAPVLCEKRGLPWAASVLAPLNFFSAIDPPLGLPGPAAAAIHHGLPGLTAMLQKLGLMAARRWTGKVQDLRSALGLPRGKNPITAGQFSPYLNLALFSRLLAEPELDWPPATVVTGSIQYDANRGAMSDDLQDFLDSGPAPVVFTLGTAAVTSHRAAHFYDMSAAAATGLGVRAVLLTGHLPENRPAVASGNIFVTEWAPHSALFPRASAIVHQGGAGTLHSALGAGRPMVVVPFAHDQPDNANRVAQLGVARVIYPQQYSAKRVHDTLAKLLADAGAAERAKAAQLVIRSEDGAGTAADALAGITAPAV